jgi:hypothetical protein
MKKLVQVTEVDGEGLDMLLGKQVILLCLNYIYTGKLIGVNKTCVLLENASIVYDTGAWNTKSFSDAQKLPFHHYVQTGAIESFGETDKA